jgi:hypothetical protein
LPSPYVLTGKVGQETLHGLERDWALNSRPSTPERSYKGSDLSLAGIWLMRISVGGRAAKGELLTDVDWVSSRPVRVLR